MANCYSSVMMPDPDRDFIASHLIDREDGRDIMRLLVIVFSAGSLVLLAFGLLDNARGPVIQSLITLLLCLVAWLLMQRSLVAAGVLMIFSVWLVILVGAFLTSGNRAVGLAGLPLLIVVSGWAIGARTALALAAMSILALFGLSVHEAMGGHYTQVYPPLHRWVMHSILLVVAAIFASAVLKKYWRHQNRRSAVSRHLKVLLENVPTCVCSVDTQHRYIYANQRYASFFGKTPAELTGAFVWDVIGHDNFDEHRDDFEGVRHGVPMHYRRDHINPETGKRRVIDVDLVPEYLSDNRTVTRYFGLLREVTEEVVAIEEARRSEARFAVLFHANPFATSISRMSDGVFIDVNPAYQALYGKTRDELIGVDSIRHGLWPSQTHREAWLATLGDGHGRHDYETRIETVKGMRDIVLTSERIDIDGVPHLLALHNDITDMRDAEREVLRLNETLEAQVRERTADLSRALEELKRSQNELIRAEKLSALGGMVAGLAHELNTPIGNAVTVASTMHEQAGHFQAQLSSGESLRKSMLTHFCDNAISGTDVLLRNLERAYTLIRNFKQVAVDQTSESRRTFLLDQTVQEIVTTMSPALKRQPVSIEIDIAEGIEIDGYPGALGQTLINLINNAVLHGFEGRGHGTIRLHGNLVEPGSDKPDQGKVRLTVEDDGIGIAEQNLVHVFEPFYTTKLGKGGSGLGLSIVYNIVTGLMGGEIHCESAPGKGTRFTVVIPPVAPPSSF